MSNLVTQWIWPVMVAASLVGILVLPSGALRGLAVLIALINSFIVTYQAGVWIRRRWILADRAETLLEAIKRRERN